MENFEQKLSDAVKFDSLNLDCLQWEGVTFWAMPLEEGTKNYGKFEVYAHGTIKLIVANPFEEHHPSGWDLEFIEFGGIVAHKLSDVPILEKGNFEDLFCAMCWLAKQQDNPVKMICDKNVPNHIALKAAITRYKRRLPEWLQETRENNKKS